MLNFCPHESKSIRLNVFYFEDVKLPDIQQENFVFWINFVFGPDLSDNI